MPNRISNDFTSTIAGSVFTKGGEERIKPPVGHEFIGFTTLADTVLYSEPDFTYPSGQTFYERKDFMQVETGNIIAYYGRVVPKSKVKKILNEFTGAAAAYSLRELSNEVNNIVRVRRDVDNSERDFSAAEVADDTLVDFCNFANELPANYGAGANAAYSLRYVYQDYSGSVVRVRRSSDNEEQDFDPTGITNGALESFVGAGNDGFVTTWYNQVPLKELSSAYGASISGTVFGTTDSYTGVAPISSGNFYRIQWTVSAIQTRGRVRFRNFANSSNITVLTGQGNLSYFTENGVYTTFVASDAGVSLVFLGDSGQGFTYSNVSIVEIDKIASDATQTSASAQGKIVDSGSLITINSKPAIQSSGTETLVFTNTTTDGFSAKSVFAVSSFEQTDSADRILYSDNFNFSNESQIITGGMSDNRITFANSVSGTSYTSNYGVMAQDDLGLLTGLFDGSSSEIYIDSVLGTSTAYKNSQNSIAGSRGYLWSLNGTAKFWIGKHCEIIIYATDQSSNQSAIEANINNYYSMFTPATNGFVTSWYDQSGNGNTAEQASAASQPKIVSSGSVILENGKPSVDFDGSDDMLTFNTLTFNPTYTHALVLKYNAISSKERVVFAGGNNAQSTLKRQSSSANYTARYVSPTTDYLIDTTFAQELVFVYRNDTQIQASLNNSLFTNATYYSNSVSIYNIGNSPSLNNGFDGNIQEVIIYNSDQASNRAAIQDNINSHYNIYT